jgi:hypothetical protein
MTAGPEHEHDHTPPGRARPRAAWLGSRRAAVLAGVIAAGLLAGAGAALAATGSAAHPASSAAATAATPAPVPSPQARLPHRLPFRIGPFHGPFGLGGPFGAGPFGAVHGQFVVAKPGGGYRTIDVQNGKVTAVSATSITLRSPDGYTHTYTVTSATIVNAQRDGIGSIKTGDEAAVQATVSGSTATAVSIQDLSLLQHGFQQFFGHWSAKNGKIAIP